MKETFWKVGELSDITGLTVRTLHYYHEKGLLIPSGISENGYRIYSKDDIIRLQQIVALKRLSFSLNEIKTILERKNFDPVEIIKNHLKIAEEQIIKYQKIKSHMETFSTILVHREAKVEDFIKIIGVFAMNEITFEVGVQLVPLVEKEQGGKIVEIISNLRKEKNFPQVRIRDNTLLKENEYRFIVKDKEIFRGECDAADIFSKENTDGLIKRLEEIIEEYDKTA
jgi:DNA-binding transcriptional MerR regulator